MKIRGHAALFDSLSENLGGFREKIQRGAFSASLESQDIVFLSHHDSAQPMARVSAGNLDIREDQTGLFFESELPSTGGGKDLHRLIETRVLTSMSFGFNIERPEDEVWEEGPDGLLIRTLRRIKLLEISVVLWPAYRMTSVTAGDTIRAARRAASPKRAHAQPIGAARAQRLREKLEASQRSCIIYGLR